jgi:hypothetical protein
MPYDSAFRARSALALVETSDVPEGEAGEQLRALAREERSILLRNGVALRLIRRIATETMLDPEEEWQRYRVYRALLGAIEARSDAELRGPGADERIFSDMFDSIDEEAP